MTVYPGRRRDPCHEWRKTPSVVGQPFQVVPPSGGHPGRLAGENTHKRDDGGAAEAVHELPVLSRCLFSLCSRSHNLFVTSINTARVILHLPWPLDPAEFLGNGKTDWRARPRGSRPEVATEPSVSISLQLPQVFLRLP